MLKLKFKKILILQTIIFSLKAILFMEIAFANNEQNIGEKELIHIKSSDLLLNTALQIKETIPKSISSIYIAFDPINVTPIHSLSYCDKKIIFKNIIKTYDQKDGIKNTETNVSVNNAIDKCEFEISTKGQNNDHNKRVSVQIGWQNNLNKGVLSFLPIIGRIFTSNTTTIPYIQSEKDNLSKIEQIGKSIIIEKNKDIKFVFDNGINNLEIMNLKIDEKEKQIVFGATNDAMVVIMDINNKDSPIKMTRSSIPRKINEVIRQLGNNATKSIFGIKKYYFHLLVNKLSNTIKNNSIAYILSYQLIVVSLHIAIVILIALLKLLRTKNIKDILILFKRGEKRPLNDNSSGIKTIAQGLVIIIDMLLLVYASSDFGMYSLERNLNDLLPIIGKSASYIYISNGIQILKNLPRLFLIFSIGVSIMTDEKGYLNSKWGLFLLFVFMIALRDKSVGEDIILSLFFIQRNLLKRAIVNFTNIIT